MSVNQIAQKLHTAIIAMDMDTIHNTLFSDSIESIEPNFPPMSHAKGIEQVKEKAKMFGGNIKELHKREIDEKIIVAGNYISLGMSFDATLQDGNRMQLSELVIYKVEDDKIVSEQFFY
ncbi:nuclear transport factor 2 family protein [Bernardetia sp. ABR2-2B]|uniref:nuclear transport factor 2 family protein n=1 Tax=Bernardetia sp. ABR2-2B TaxID=3127472 RepID=UPI0030CE7758